MPYDNAANINSTGILISSTNLQTLELSEDQSMLSIGPGKRWGDAYTYLKETQPGEWFPVDAVHPSESLVIFLGVGCHSSATNMDFCRPTATSGIP